MNTEALSPLSDIHLAKVEIAWFNPALLAPPFDMKLLLMVAGSKSEDAGKSWEDYTLVLTGYVKQTSPSDECEDELAVDEFQASATASFLDYQFDLHDDDGNPIEDWWSDGIVAWAYYPIGAGQAAIDASKARGSV